MTPPPGAPRLHAPPITSAYGNAMRLKAVDYGFLSTQRAGLDDWPLDPGLFGIETQPLMPRKEGDGHRRPRVEPPGGPFGLGWKILIGLCALSVVICYADRSNIATAILPMSEGAPRGL